MFGLLLRIMLLALVVLVIVSFFTSGYERVCDFYWWMLPDPAHS